MAEASSPGESSFRALFEAAWEAILVVDLDSGRILQANRAASELLGYTREEFKSLTAADIHPHELADFRTFARRVARQGSCRTAELACRCKTGQLLPAEISASAVEFQNRHAMLAVIRNLRRERLAEVGAAVAKIAHDLRNILARARLLSERLEASQDPETRRIAVDVVATVDRAVELCDNTLRAGRAEEPVPQLTCVPLRALIEDIALIASLKQPGAPDWLNEVGESMEVMADRDQLYRALLNLTHNAVQATPLDGLIIFRAAQAGKNVVLEVADSGPGLPEPLCADPFRHYARSGSHGGTGLGLMIARELVIKQGGRLDLAHTGPQGTTFRLELPGASKDRKL